MDTIFPKKQLPESDFGNIFKKYWEYYNLTKLPLPKLQLIEKVS